MTRGSLTYGLSHAGSDATKKPPLDDERHEQVVIAVLVEEDGHLVAVVALHSALAPMVARNTLADGERLVRRLRHTGCEVVVAVPARAGIVLAEVREQERAAAAGVLGVAAHHLEPRALDLILTLGLHLGGSDRGRNVERAGPSHLAACLPDCGAEIDKTDERAGQLPRRPSRGSVGERCRSARDRRAADAARGQVNRGSEVLRPEEQPRVGRFLVAAGAADLLVVGVERRR